MPIPQVSLRLRAARPRRWRAVCAVAPFLAGLAPCSASAQGTSGGGTIASAVDRRDGTGRPDVALYRLNEPRTFLLTSTFSL